MVLSAGLQKKRCNAYCFVICRRHSSYSTLFLECWSCWASTMPPKKRPNNPPSLKRSKRLEEENKENFHRGDSEPESETEFGPESDSDDDYSEGKRRGRRGRRGRLSKSSSAAKPAVIRGVFTSMVFPKGTYVIRLRDVVDGDVKWIWRIDHHQLIQKYLFDEQYGRSKNGLSRWYIKSFRYCGWFCNEAWNFLVLNVTSEEGNDERVQVKFPSVHEIEEARSAAIEENRKRQIPYD